MRIVLKKPIKLIMMILVLAGVSCLGVFPATRLFESCEAEDYSALDPYIDSEMKKNLVPGLSLVIFNDQEIEFSKGYGVKKAKSGEFVDENTIFQAASLSKTLTAYAAMILVERGKLALNIPLNRYLKQEYLDDSKAAGQITLQMILTHTSGMSNDSDGNDRNIYFRPGTQFSYSGAGFRYLQQVIEDITELPFAEFMEEEIFKPIGMTSSSFVLKDEMLPLMANGHEGGRAFPITKKDANAAYSLLSTPTDIARFIREIYHPSLLKPETVDQMLKPTVRWQNSIYWGLGIGIIKSQYEDFIWHWGNNYYYCSIMIAGKDSKKGVVIMTNGNAGMKMAGRLAVKIINTYFHGNENALRLETFDFTQ